MNFISCTNTYVSNYENIIAFECFWKDLRFVSVSFLSRGSITFCINEHVNETHCGKKLINDFKGKYNGLRF